MSVYRPAGSKVYWIDFVFAGDRIRESTKTVKKTIATNYETNRKLQLQRAYSGEFVTSRPRDRVRGIRAALAAYEKAYGINHRAKGLQTVEERSVPLERHLGALLALDVTTERVVRYMADRRTEGAGNRTINMELSILARALGSKFQILWPNLKRLEERSDVGKALTADQERAVLDAAARNSSRMILPFVYLALASGLRRDEIRLLKWSQVDFAAKEITVGDSKTEAGQGRAIPFGVAVESVLTTYIGWYVSKLGRIDPAWHVFPFSNRRKPVDPTRPVTDLKKSWKAVCDAAGVSARFHDLRHTLCTKLGEKATPEATMLAIMGHVSSKMLKRYSHVRKLAKVEAMLAVEPEAFSDVHVKVSPKVSDFEAVKTAVTH